MTTTKRRKPSGSTLLAGLCVAGAAAIAWFGGFAQGQRSTGSVPVTIAAAEALAESPPARTYATISQGGLPTRIVISSAGIDAPVAEVGVVMEKGHAVWETAWRAAGHHIDSAMPGQPGNVVITGHVSVADRRNLAAFATLDRVSDGDIVQLHSGDAVYSYTVERVAVVPPDAVQLLRSDSRAIVTLITCTPDLKNRLVVIARLAEPQAPSAGV